MVFHFGFVDDLGELVMLVYLFDRGHKKETKRSPHGRQTLKIENNVPLCSKRRKNGTQDLNPNPNAKPNAYDGVRGCQQKTRSTHIRIN